MVNYNQGKIYKLVNEEGLTYYGSTCKQYLSQRLADHNKSIKSNAKITTQKLGDFTKVKIFLVENYPCNSKDELLSREKHYIVNNQCVNKQIPTRERTEWLKDNREDQNKKASIRYHNNASYKEKRKEYNAKPEIKEKLKQHCKERDQKEEYKQKRKEWRKVKILCECGLEVCRGDISSHKKTKSHLLKVA